ncbi:venom protein 302-like [Uloborus diversus]|uniref:venom protein 302-like n=1 Tax=Uloborus diversus TaxID=327109 RepID=UPI002409684A|nr:venom protein 302-like [Uloborus diversus]
MALILHDGMKSVLWIVLVISLVVSCFGLDCPACDHSKCPKLKECKLGETTDVCGCCAVCYKTVGEECGGPWNIFGVCANHLTCIRLPRGTEDPIKEFNSPGKCLALP